MVGEETSPTDLVNEQRLTVQGRLKELTQKELLFKLQDFECEQVIEEKAWEYELQITDAQVGVDWLE